MATNGMTTVSVPQALLAEVEKLAQTQERTASDLVSDVMAKYLSEQRWRALQAYGRERARALGYTEDDVERLIAESRREHGL
jgi:metal-responsive CopG/Arc/MetJ family transcriptional regulator